MDLYLRFLFVIVTALRRSTIATDSLSNEVSIIVLPNDLDINLHMNNGRYLTVCDSNRVDFFVRPTQNTLRKRYNASVS